MGHSGQKFRLRHVCLLCVHLQRLHLLKLLLILCDIHEHNRIAGQNMLIPYLIDMHFKTVIPVTVLKIIVVGKDIL